MDELDEDYLKGTPWPGTVGDLAGAALVVVVLLVWAIR